MKTPILLTLLAGIALLPATQARDNNTGSQKGDAQQNRPPQPPPSPLVAAVDTNHDKTISAAEITDAAATLITLDKNSDGRLTKEEFSPKPPPPRQGGKGADKSKGKGKTSRRAEGGHRPPPDPMVKALDVDKDRAISAEEIANAADELLTIDKNDDGQLTRDEFAPRPPRPPQGGQQDADEN